MGDSGKEGTSIEGTLLMLDDRTPHVAVVVQAISDGEVMATIFSDEQGRYHFIGLKSGEYQVRCYTMDGYMYYGEGGNTIADESIAVFLQIRPGVTHDNINFRFPPLKKGTWRTYTHFDGLASNTVHASYYGPDGVMWFGTAGGGVSQYDGKEFVNLTTKDGLVNNMVHAIHSDPDGVIWFGTWGGVSRYDGRGIGDSHHFVNFTTDDGLADNHVSAVYCAPDGIVWFGTSGGGVSRYDARGMGDSPHFVNFTTKDGLANNHVTGIHGDPDGAIWFATWGGGVSRYDPKGIINFTTKDGLVDNNVNVIYRDPDGVMWFGTSRTWGMEGGGISRYDGKEFVNFTTEDGLAYNSVSAIHRDPDGVMWFATGFMANGGGIARYDGNEFVNLTTEDGLAHNSVSAIYCDPDGTMWFGTRGSLDERNGGVSRYDGKKFVNLTTVDGLVSNHVISIHCDPGGVMWFGTNRGVSRYDGSKFVNFTTEDGLVDNHVSAIHSDPDGVIWFGTGSGVSAYDGTSWTSLDTRDGLAGNGVGSILQDPEGFLWFATEGGVTRYRRSTTPPKAHIVSVTTDRTYRDLSAIPAFTPGTRVTMEYSSIDFKTLPEKRQYRFYIKEIDSDWRKPTKETSFDYIFEEPGNYTFEVQAIDRGLNYSEPASVKLEVIPDPRNHRIIQLEEHIRQQELAELERLHRELEDARQIQLSLLPEKPPEIEGFEIADTSLPAKEVSGDFYSYLSLGKNIGIALGDVTGKSVKAAMVAAMTNGMLQSEIKSRKELCNSSSKILMELNASLQANLIRGMNTAMSLAIIGPGKKLIFSNAGMPYPVVKRGNRAWEMVVNGMPLGITDMAEYEDFSLEFEKGDFVVFCSDGVIEAENLEGEMYQSDRLLEVIGQADPNLSAQGMLDLILGDVIGYVGDEEASDDITIVILRCME